MSLQDIQRTGQELVNLATVTEQKIAISTNQNARLENAIAAAELYMQALRLIDDPAEKRRIDCKTRELISIAEGLKALNNVQSHGLNPINRSRTEHPTSKRKLTKREEIILLEGSKLNGTLFKPWTTTPQLEEFSLKDESQWFTDNVEFSLSEAQTRHFAGWARANEAVALIRREKDGHLLPNEGTMNKLGIWDLVQDVAPDCSVVASLCVGTARAEKGHKRILKSIVHPYDQAREHPIMSANGKYVMRLYFNGCWRRVEIDDRLPTSKTSRVLFVIDRSHPGLIWPALVEKAYLKVRGGYDFPGSNSGTDLAVLTGWIPQQVFLHDEDVDPGSLWQELFPSFTAGEIMMTLGTGKLGQREQRQLGLGAEHDYAVLDMKDTDHIREVLIKNPWADGDVWKSATRCKPHPGHEGPESNISAAGEQMMPGTFWMDFNSLFQHFEHMYINWDPGLFKYREDVHFTHHLTSITTTGYLLIDQPQFAVYTKDTGEVRILLNRHFRIGDFTSQNHGKNGYISLYLFNSKGVRVFSSEEAQIRGPFVDSPNTLLRFQSKADGIYTIVVMTQDLPIGKHNFTLSTFSSGPVELSPALQKYQEPITLKMAWTRLTAGGSSDSPQYLQNPQLNLRVDRDMKIALILQVVNVFDQELQSDIHVKLLITASDGNRITKLRPRDFTAQSGDYRRGCAILETEVTRGNYSVICSTFQQGQLAQFSIDCYSTDVSQCFLRTLPAEGSGRLSISINPALFTEGVTKLAAQIKVLRTTKTLFRCSQVQSSGSVGFRLLLEQGQGPYRRCLASSASDEAAYTSITSDLRISDVTLSPSLASEHVGGLWLVVEQPAVSSVQRIEQCMVRIEALSEERIEIGAWKAIED